MTPSADVRAWMTAELNRYCGGPESGRSAFGHPSKMPGLAYGIPAAECITGTAREYAKRNPDARDRFGDLIEATADGLNDYYGIKVVSLKSGECVVE